MIRKLMEFLNHNLKLQCKKFSRTRDIRNFPTQGWAGTAFCTRKRSETYYLPLCLPHNQHSSLKFLFQITAQRIHVAGIKFVMTTSTPTAANSKGVSCSLPSSLTLPHYNYQFSSYQHFKLLLSVTSGAVTSEIVDQTTSFMVTEGTWIQPSGWDWTSCCPLQELW